MMKPFLFKKKEPKAQIEELHQADIRQVSGGSSWKFPQTKVSQSRILDPTQWD